MLEPFLLRALAAAIGVALIAAPLGALVVWNRMAYFGETVAQASLLGVALGLALNVDLTVSVVAIALFVAALLMLLSRQKAVPLDSILGLTHHGTLALGVVATAMLEGPAVDLMGYLFGDIFAVSTGDLVWIYGGGALVLALVAWLWQPLLRLAVHDELAAAEGVDPAWVKGLFMALLAVAIALTMKVVGILLAIAFLIVPVVAARPLSATPERMVLLTAVVSLVSVVIGLGLSTSLDVPGGPAIVLVMAALAGASVAVAALRRKG
ncbi:MAG: metal ABC transporter permease [Hyphomicrobium sp.]